MIRVYLDVSCLNRIDDDQRQARIRLETEAISIIANPLSWLEEQKNDSNS
jgi:hypothetical protein